MLVNHPLSVCKIGEWGTVTEKLSNNHTSSSQMRFSNHEEPVIVSIYFPIEMILDNDKAWLLLLFCTESESIKWLC